MSTYVQRDLGYERAKTDALFRVEMPDGSDWDVPVQVIVDDRDACYAQDKEDTIQGIRDGSLSDYEIYDWAGNNMNWSDVKQYAVQAPPRARKVDWEDGWCNGDKRIVGEL